jgi:hypothetical protein
VIASLAPPESWDDLPLFLHVLGAMTLVGGMIAVTVLAFAAASTPQHALLARATLWTSLAVVVPAWIVMRAAAEWIYSREHSNIGSPNWIGVGMAVSDGGLLVVLVTAGLSFWWARRGGEGWQGRALGVLGVLYLVALAFAWFVMAAKPGL